MCAKISWFLHTIFSPCTYAMVSGIPIALKDNKAKYKCQQIVARMLFICMNFDEKRPLRMSVVNISLLSNHIRCNIKSESYLEQSRICVALYWIFNFQWHCSWGRPTSIQNEDAKCQCQHETIHWKLHSFDRNGYDCQNINWCMRFSVHANSIALTAPMHMHLTLHKQARKQQ